MWNKLFKKLKMKCQISATSFFFHFVNVYNLYNCPALQTTKRIWLRPKTERLHECNNVLQSINELKKSGSGAVNFTKWPQVKTLKRYSESCASLVGTKKISITSCTGHKAHLREAEVQTSHSAFEGSSAGFQIIELSQSLHSIHSLGSTFVINAKTHLWDTALPMHKVSLLKSS